MKLKFYPIIVIAAIISNSLFAQTSCPGEIIEFRETFGTGSATTSLSPGRTTYNYNSTTSLSDGDYKIYKNTQGRPEWHNSADHTGDVNGKMMVINASYAAGEFYKDTLYNIKDASFYSVYLYVMNVNTLGTCGSSAILPKLQFIVEYLNNGSYTQLTSFTSAFIPQTSSPTWVKVGGNFFLPAGVTSVRYRILNNSSGGCGNDLAIDDITFSHCTEQTTLPIKGLKINVEAQNGNALINFSTENEYNTLSFDVEKSTDNRNWQTITSIAAAGNSDVRKYYSTTDVNVNSQVTYYRIKQSDIDGQFSYSSVVVFKTNGSLAGSAIAYPNPFRSNLAVQYNSNSNEPLIVRMTDQQGRIVKLMNWNIKKGMNLLQLDNMDRLSTGLYYIDAVTTESVKIFSQKLVKQ